MIEKKYKLTKESIRFDGRTLYRIEATKDFSNIKKGDKGGFVESEENLLQIGNTWVSVNAKVYGDACVYDNAVVSDNAIVCGNAKVSDYAYVKNNAMVFDNAKVSGYACVSGNTRVYGNAKVSDYAYVKNNAMVFDNAKVSDYACVSGDTRVYGNAKVSGKALVSGNAKVSGNANVCANEDYIVFKNWWSSGRYFTWTRSNNMWSVGCFYGTGEELIAKAYKDSKLSGREYERVVKYVESILKEEELFNELSR